MVTRLQQRACPGPHVTCQSPRLALQKLRATPRNRSLEAIAGSEASRTAFEDPDQAEITQDSFASLVYEYICALDIAVTNRWTALVKISQSSQGLQSESKSDCIVGFGDFQVLQHASVRLILRYEKCLIKFSVEMEAEKGQNVFVL